jgi:hypothetical protein
MSEQQQGDEPMVEIEAEALASALDGMWSDSPKGKLQAAASRAASAAKLARRDDAVDLLALDSEGVKPDSQTVSVSIALLEQMRKIASQQENSARRLRETLTVLLGQALEPRAAQADSSPNYVELTPEQLRAHVQGEVNLTQEAGGFGFGAAWPS